MNVSPTWLEQIQIAEHGSQEQKIALAQSDDLLDSVQPALAKSYQSNMVKNALANNPKLTPLAKLLLVGKNNTLDDWRFIYNITDEETLRAYTIHPNDIIHHPNLPESIAIDLIDIDLINVICNLNYFKVLDNQKLPLLFSYKCFLMKLIEGVFSQKPQWHSIYRCNYNIFADYLIDIFSKIDFLDKIDDDIHIFLANTIKDYEFSHNQTEMLFDCHGHKITKGGICLDVIERLANSPKITLNAKIILHDMLDVLQNKK